MIIVAFFALQNINSFHDWGDDFAQYLYQAKVFIEGNQQLQLYSTEYYSPRARGAGFSFFLSFIYQFFGLDISAFLTGISLTYFLLSLVLYFFFLSYFEKNQKLNAALFSLVFVLNYHVLDLKNEIMPSFPLMLMMYLFFVGWKSKNKMFRLLALLCLSFAMSIANIAWVILLALVVDSLLKFIFKREEKKFSMLIFEIVFPVLCYFSIKSLVFNDYKNEEISWYANVFQFQDTLNLVFINLQYYYHQTQLFWEQEIWFWFNFGTRWVLVLLFFVGFIFRWLKKVNLIDWFFIFYFFVLLIYPYQKAGIRFLMPLIPIFLIYVTEALRLIFSNKIFSNYRKAFYSIAFSILIMSNFVNWKNWMQESEISNSPQSKLAVEAFEYIQQNTKKNDIIAFSKPWTMLLFGERSSMPISSEIKEFELIKMMQKNKSEYLLYSKNEDFKNSYENFHLTKKENPTLFKLVWKNEAFELYKLTTKAAINN